LPLTTGDQILLEKIITWYDNIHLMHDNQEKNPLSYCVEKRLEYQKKIAVKNGSLAIPEKYATMEKILSPTWRSR
jgi:hypothetical protein